MTVAAIRDLRNGLDGLRTEHLVRDASASRDDLIARSFSLADQGTAINIPELTAIAGLRRAEIQIFLRRWTDALESLDVARRTIDAFPAREHGVFLRRMEAQSYAGLERWEDVRRVTREGIAIIEPARGKVSPLTLQNSYLRFRITLYELAARAEVELGNWEEALAIAELVKCRSLSRLIEAPPASPPEKLIRDYRRVCDEIDVVVTQGGNPERLLARRQGLWHLLQISRLGGGARAAGTLTLADLQRSLDADEAVLNYFWLDTTRLLVVAFNAEEAAYVQVLLPDHVRRRLDELAAALQSPRPPNSAAELSGALRDTLIPEAVRGPLRSRTRLYVSPHRVLHALPFHALPWNDGYLIEAYATTYVPNLSVMLRRDRSPVPDGVLAVGVFKCQVPSAASFPALSAAKSEVVDLQEIYGHRCRPLIDVDATQESLSRMNDAGELAQFGIMHIACHGLNIDSDNPMESMLFLHDAVLDGLDIATWRIGARLVVLSACCSGQRPVAGRGMTELPGDELFGLQAAFFAAGARQMVSTMWPVDSEAAGRVGTDFHRALAGGAPADVALQRATLAYLSWARQSKSLKSQRPYTWAPFALTACARA